MLDTWTLWESLEFHVFRGVGGSRPNQVAGCIKPVYQHYRPRTKTGRWMWESIQGLHFASKSLAGQQVILPDLAQQQSLKAADGS